MPLTFLKLGYQNWPWATWLCALVVQLSNWAHIPKWHSATWNQWWKQLTIPCNYKEDFIIMLRDSVLNSRDPRPSFIKNRNNFKIRLIKQSFKQGKLEWISPTFQHVVEHQKSPHLHKNKQKINSVIVEVKVPKPRGTELESQTKINRKLVPAHYVNWPNNTRLADRDL